MLKLPKNTLFCKKELYYFQNAEEVTRDQVKYLLKEYQLAVGDLVYLPRGVMHRGYGGVLAPVITVPGFIPGSKYGVDHFILWLYNKANLRNAQL